MERFFDHTHVTPKNDGPSVKHELGDVWPEPTSIVSSGDNRIAYYRFGRGPDVFFIHGWPLHAATFRHMVRGLQGSFTCHLIDLPGAGATRHVAGAVDLRRHPRTVLDVIDHVGLDRFAIVAHDSGGLVARRIAAEDGRVAALVLGNTEVPDHTPALVKVYAIVARLLGTRPIAEMLRIGALRRSGLGFGGCFTDPATVDGEFGELFVAPLLASAERARAQLSLLETLHPSLTRDLTALHARIRTPSLLVWGQDDPFFPVARARSMVSELAGPTTLAEIPRAKLFAHEDHPQAFLAHVAPFLDRTMRAERREVARP